MSLEQRRRTQLLLLMYKKSKDRSLHKIFVRDTRVSKRIVLYKQSPYFVGTKLWNELPKIDIEMPDIFSFKKSIKHNNNVYIDLL